MKFLLLTIAFISTNLYSQGSVFSSHLVQKKEDTFFGLEHIDFDNDGKKDFLMGGEWYLNESQQLKWYKGTEGIYQAQYIDGFDENFLGKTYVKNSSTGFYDIYSYIDGSIYVYYQTSSGFSEKQLFFSETIGSLFEFKIADVNNDSNLDVITYEENGNVISIFIYINNNGIFEKLDVGANYDTSQTSLNYHYKQLYVLDMNSDGFIDIVSFGREYDNSVNHNKDYIVYLKNNGNDTFSKSNIMDMNQLINNTDNGFYGENILTIADQNNDGLLDIYLSTLDKSLSNPEWGVDFIQQGINDTFNVSRLINFGFSGKRAKLLLLDDDNDQDLDIVALAYRNGSVNYFENLGGNTYNTGILLLDLGYFKPVHDAFIVEGENGLFDLIVYEDYRVNKYKQISQFSFEKHSFSNEFSGSIALSDTIDFDKNEHKELIVVSSENSSLYMYLNSQSETFYPILLDSKESNMVGLKSYDYNNDGFEDVIVASVPFNVSNKMEFYWYKNLNGISFQKNYIGEVQSLNSFGTTVYFEDLDADGDLDLIKRSNYKLSWFENINNQFQASQLITSVIQLSSGSYLHNSLVDYDNDGDMDIVVSQQSCTFLCFRSTGWWEMENASYSFNSFEDDVYYSVFKPVDLNNDNLLDFLTRKIDGEQSIWINNGTSFDKIPFEDFNFSHVGSFSDVDNNGFMDVILTHSIYYNYGNLEFVAKPIVFNDQYESIYKAVDINSDNSVDFITTFGENFYFLNKGINLIIQSSFNPVPIPIGNFVIICLLIVVGTIGICQINKNFA